MSNCRDTGLNACHRLDLVKRIYNINEYTKASIDNEYLDCYDEIGCLPGIHHIELKPNAIPVVSPTRRIPFALNAKVIDELRRMEKLGVIEKVAEPTDWLHTLVVVEKPDGKVRLCLDPRNLNKVIKREHFQLPTTESIMAKMKHAKYWMRLPAIDR